MIYNGLTYFGFYGTTEEKTSIWVDQYLYICF